MLDRIRFALINKYALDNRVDGTVVDHSTHCSLHRRPENASVKIGGGTSVEERKNATVILCEKNQNWPPFVVNHICIMYIYINSSYLQFIGSRIN